MTVSYQPQRRSRPVETPTSPPTFQSFSPSASNSSVGNGPDPTRVVYALITPITRSIRVGPTPAPVHTPPAIGFEEVTKGYVPWSTSSIVACAPSNSTVLPSSRARLSSSDVSATIGRSRSTYERSSSTTASIDSERRVYRFGSGRLFYP